MLAGLAGLAGHASLVRGGKRTGKHEMTRVGCIESVISWLDGLAWAGPAGWIVDLRCHTDRRARHEQSGPHRKLGELAGARFIELYVLAV